MRPTFWLKDVTPAPTVNTAGLVKATTVARWISKPFSLLELLVHVNVTRSCIVFPGILTADPAKSDGAAGAVKYTVAVFELKDEPPALTAVM